MTIYEVLGEATRIIKQEYENPFGFTSYRERAQKFLQYQLSENEMLALERRASDKLFAAQQASYRAVAKDIKAPE